MEWGGLADAWGWFQVNWDVVATGVVCLVIGHAAGKAVRPLK